MTKYKQTEVGLIPEDWVVKSIESITNNIIDFRGVTPKKKGMEWGNGNIVALSAGNVKKGYIDFNADCYYGSEELYKKWMTSGDVAKDDIVFTMEAPLGNVALIPDNKKYILSQRTILLQLNREEYSPNYVFQQLISDKFQTYIKKSSTGSTAKGIKRQIFEKLILVFPPKPNEQKPIAQVLSDTDALIQALEKKIAKKKLIKKGVMQRLLTPKQDWEETKISKIGQPFGGLSGKSKKDFSDGNASYIPFMNVMSNPIIDTKYVEKVKIGKGESQNRVLKGDLLFNGSSETPEEVGFCSVLLEDITDLYLNSFCFGLRIFNQEDYDGLFLAYYFRSSQGRKFFYSLAQGATRYNLSKTNFLKSSISLPSYEEQIETAEIIRSIDSEINELSKVRDKYLLAKQGMMQQLLTGKIRLV